MNKDRYFIVFYQHKSGRMIGSGFVRYITQGSYVNYDLIEKEIKSNNEKSGIIIINSILELTESDYNDFIKE